MLEIDGLDLQRPDMGIYLELVEGLDGVPETRGDDDVIPGRSGRLFRRRWADSRSLVLHGLFTDGAGLSSGSTMRAYLDDAKRLLAPDRKSLARVSVGMEDGTRRWAFAVPGNWIVNPTNPEFRVVSIALEAIDPFWYSAWGVIALDSGLFLDAGLFLDDSAALVIVPTTSSYVVDVDTLGSADVERVAVTFVGPSSGFVGIEATTEDGTTYGFTTDIKLNPGGTLAIDNFARTSIRDGAHSRRASMTLRDENLAGEYLRLGAGRNSIRILGRPSQAIVSFTPTWQ